MCCGILTITYVWTAMWMTEMKAVPTVYAWQRWPRGYEPTDQQLIAMTDEEYDMYAQEYERWLAVTELEEMYGDGAKREYALTCFQVV